MLTKLPNINFNNITVTRKVVSYTMMQGHSTTVTAKQEEMREMQRYSDKVKLYWCNGKYL